MASDDELILYDDYIILTDPLVFENIVVLTLKRTYILKKNTL